jgi:hypothetical protein
MALDVVVTASLIMKLDARSMSEPLAQVLHCMPPTSSEHLYTGAAHTPHSLSRYIITHCLWHSHEAGVTDSIAEAVTLRAGYGLRAGEGAVDDGGGRQTVCT